MAVSVRLIAGECLVMVVFVVWPEQAASSPLVFLKDLFSAPSVLNVRILEPVHSAPPTVSRAVMLIA